MWIPWIRIQNTDNFTLRQVLPFRELEFFQSLFTLTQIYDSFLRT
jgi:hypothetical protein